MIQTKAAIIHSPEDIEIFTINVSNHNYKLVRKRLEIEHDKIIKILKILQNEGEIKSLSKPKNKHIQKQLDKLVEAKKLIKNSILNISEFYYK